MSAVPSPAARTVLRRLFAGVAAVGTTLALAQPALAAEFSAELVGTATVVPVAPGSTANFTIDLLASGSIRCGETATARVKTTYSIAGTGPVDTGTTFSSPAAGFFTETGQPTNKNCAVEGSRTIKATVTVAVGTRPGLYDVVLTEAAGNLRLTNTNNNPAWGSLIDQVPTTLTFRVLGPANSPPVAGTAPAAATGDEGSTLQSAGTFTDPDGDLASIEVSGGGTVQVQRTALGKPTGVWSWALVTSDQVSGTATVTAHDSFGESATQTFSYVANNVAPRVTVEAADAHGIEGGTLGTFGSFADISEDPLSITVSRGLGTVVGHADGTYTWTLPVGNETSGTVEVTATDGDGGSTTDSFSYRAANVAPGIRTDAQDVTGPEGSSLTNGGAFGDVPADPLTVAATGAGKLATATTDGSWSWELPGAEDGSGQVAVTASDGLATSAPDTFAWTVLNVPPDVALAANDRDGFEGTTLQANGRFSDAGTDPLTVTLVSGPGEVTGSADGTWSWSLDATDDLADTVVVEANDGDGGVRQDSFDVTVRGLAPVLVDPAAADATGAEGATLMTGGRFTDVPADVVTITATPAVGTLETGADGSWSWALDSVDDVARGSVTVTATDDDGLAVSDTFEYEAVDVAPRLVRAATDSAGNEGDTLTADGAFDDVAADRITVAKVSGPGTVTDLGDGAWTYSLATTDELSDTVVVRATDKDGRVSETDEFAVTAVNVAPAVGAAPRNATGSEGATLAATGSFTDVDHPVSLTLDSGDGTLTDHGDGTWTWNLATGDDSAGTVVVRADDGDGGVTRAQFTYSAANVAPELTTLTVTGATGVACQTGNVVRLQFGVTDPGTADTMAGTVNWGDGSADSAFTGRSVDLTHSYPAGSYTVTVAVTDDDGAAAAGRTASVSRTYRISSVGAPFNLDGSSVFRWGSVAPVKVRILDCLDGVVRGLAPTIRVFLANGQMPGAPINEAVESVSAADTTGVLRYDGSGGYLYNFATRSLRDADARYVLEVQVGGASTWAAFAVRTK